MRQLTRCNLFSAAVWVLWIAVLVQAFPASGLAGPLRVSANGRYFIDCPTGQPFFWLGSTQWAIFRGYTLEEARLTVDKLRSKGYTVLATMLAGGTVATVPNPFTVNTRSMGRRKCPAEPGSRNQPTFFSSAPAGFHCSASSKFSTSST